LTRSAVGDISLARDKECFKIPDLEIGVHKRGTVGAVVIAL